MLKSFSDCSMSSFPNAKCAEVYLQSSTSFTIVCTFCEMKAFEFDDFLLHFKNVHFENNLLKPEENIECTSFLEINIKNEVNKVDKSDNEERDELMVSDLPIIEDNDDTTNWNYDNSRVSSEDEEFIDDEDYHDDDYNDDDKDYKPTRKNFKETFKKFECVYCNKRYKTEAILKHHIKKYHDENEDSRQQCSQCAALCRNVRQLNEHMLKVHSGFQCTQCDKKFRTRYDLKRHEVIHTGIKNFVCDFENCGKSFYTRRRLTIHRHIHEGSKNFICETCGYSCRIKAMLKVHYRSHTGEKPYACDMCDKRFASSSMLNEHKPMHSTERPHICDVCGATFSRPKALYHHKHLHLGVKKFKCKICGNAYAQAAGLAGHMRQHKQATMF